jgi:hypothetical protein
VIVNYSTDKIGFRRDENQRGSRIPFLTMIVKRGLVLKIKRFYDLNKVEPFSNGERDIDFSSMGTQHFFLKSCDTEYLSRVIIQFLLFIIY